MLINRTKKRAVAPPIGTVFSRLTVVSAAMFSRANRYKLTVRCACGTEKEVSIYYLLSGLVKSCGCLRTEMATVSKTTHGLRSAPEYGVYDNMMSRCNNPKHIDYKLYGGRGIKICPEWSGNFAKFYEDLGPRPSPEHQLDRIDNSLGYSKDNCRWVTRSENNRNKRNTIMIEHEGEVRPLIEWAERYGLNYNCCFYRYRQGDRGDKLFRPSQISDLIFV